MSDARIVDGLRAPSLAIIAPDHRLWPHTEALKAATALSRRRMVHSISAGQYAAVLLEKFCDRPFEGGWVDRVDPSGQAISQDVPASSLYHLMLAGVEAAKTIASVAGSIGEPDARHS
jgi:mannose/cellobiose epimerase-like protein (N-acyl-D-glucosamine 2-epimerase family)